MPKKKVAIIDYEMGNLFSVQHACEFIGLEPFISNDSSEILSADAAILPGVGAFGDAMSNLNRLKLVDPIKSFINSGRPFLGICLGLQLLFTQSEEFGVYKGLDIIKGSVKKFPTKNNNCEKVKVPQIGWNQIQFAKGYENNFLFKGINNGEYMYFVHSFYVDPDNVGDIATTTNYEGIEYCSSVIRDNIFACQFHPEKSANEGIKVYQNWAKIINN
jgi:glutamine amidotransferase